MKADSQSKFSNIFTRARMVVNGIKKDMHKVGLTEDLTDDRAHFSNLIQHFNRFSEKDKKKRNAND